MYIGRGIRRTIVDIVEQEIPIDQIEKVYEGLEVLSPEEWKNYISGKEKTLWPAYPAECKKVFLQLIDSGKIAVMSSSDSTAKKFLTLDKNIYWLLDGEPFSFQ